MSMVLLDGRLVPRSQAMLSVFDRSVLFSDALYEVVAVYEKKMFYFDLHWDRLAFGARELEINIPMTSDQLAEDLYALIEAHDNVGGVYFQLTRGAGVDRSHAPQADLQPTWFGFTLPPINPPSGNDALVTCPDNRFGLCYIKTTNLLANGLAKQAAQRAGAREAVFVRDGLVTEASSSSVFMVINGALYTHPLANILPGITRHLVINIARDKNIPVIEEALPVRKLLTADEVFITGTLSEVVPITAVDGHQISDGKPGPITSQIRAGYKQLITDVINS